MPIVGVGRDRLFEALGEKFSEYAAGCSLILLHKNVTLK